MEISIGGCPRERTSGRFELEQPKVFAALSLLLEILEKENFKSLYKSKIVKVINYTLPIRLECF